MIVFLYLSAAITAYLISGWNPAITFSKAVYKTDIRTCGSKNPGFTNFKRVFGNRWAWFVFALDLSKAAVAVLLFGYLFSRNGYSFQYGAAYTGAFTLLGHAYPVWYGFKGGKGFLVTLSTVWVIDWRVGLIATLTMVILLLITKYMSLSTVAALLLSPILLIAFGADTTAIVLCAICVAFVTVRHRQNFKRLLSGTEAKFSVRSQR